MTVLTVYPGSDYFVGSDTIYGASTYWQAILTNDDGTSYIKRSTNSYSDYIFNPNFVIVSGTINSITIKYVARSGTASGVKAKSIMYSNDTIYYGSEQSITNTSYDTYSDTWTTGWTWEEVFNNFKFGISLKAPWGGAVPIYCTQVYAEIDYTPVANESLTYLRPESNGTYSQVGHQYPNYTYHYDKVYDEIADDDSTYIYASGTSYYVDTYEISNIQNCVVKRVAVVARVRSTAITNGTMKGKCAVYTNGELKYGNEVFITSDNSGNGVGYTNIIGIWDTNPSTLTSWSPSDVNNLEIGIALKSFGAIAFRCTQVYCMIVTTPLSSSRCAQMIGAV